MMDCYIDTYIERAWRQYVGHYRAQVIYTKTGSIIYQTWPYRSEHAARSRARRWLREEYKRANEPLELFGGQ